MTKEVKTKVEESSRMWASASFVGVLIVIGVPLWWKTTEVYRVSLPFEKIAAFDALPFVIATDLVVLANDEATANEIAQLIEETFDDSNLIKLNITKRVLPDALRSTLESVAEEVEATEEVIAAVGAVAPNALVCVQRAPLYKQVWVSSDRVVFFRDARAGATLVSVLAEWIYQTRVLAGAATGDDEATRLRYPPAPGYHVLLSVVVPESERPVNFTARQAMEDYIGSFVDELSGVHDFILKSQWLYELDYDFETREIFSDKAFGHHFAVAEVELFLLLTELEERTATQVSHLPTINLVIYAVPCKIAPLIIYPEDGEPRSPALQDFLSPKWGGVVFANPTAEQCATGAPNSPDLKIYMTAFVEHLRSLLGIMDPTFIDGARLQRLRSVTPRRWEADALMRLRLQEQLAAGKLALQSLAQLLAEISNIVINDDVGKLINDAVAGIYKATELMSEGHLEEAFKVSQKAFLEAEAAFADPSLLALLYFPDDQKYAIYIPLFLPIMFPVVLSLKNLFLWMRGKPLHKEKAD